ncbi:MAG: hypothetical protein ACKN9V_03795 [Pseudomonadota bacterium]
MATLKNILSLSAIALLFSACGTKNQAGYYDFIQGPSNTPFSPVMSAGTFAGALPQTVPPVPNNSFSNSPLNQTVPPQAALNQTNLNQTAQNFGYLNDCYRRILQEGNSYFQSGIDPNAIFLGAGQALVRCYNTVLQTRVAQQQQWQAYISSVYQQNYINQMYAAYRMSQQYQNQTAQFTISKPPGVR